MRNPALKPQAIRSRFAASVGGWVAIAVSCAGTMSGLGMMAAPLLLAPSVYAAPLTRWAFDPATDQLEITVPKGITPRYFLAAEPARIVLDLPGIDVGAVSMQQAYTTGAIRQIRIAQFQPSQARIVLELSADAVLAPGQVELRRVSESAGGDRWILRPLLAAAMPPVAAAPAPAVAPVPPVSSVTPTPAVSPASPASPVPIAPPASAVAPVPAAPTVPTTIATPSMTFPLATPATPAEIPAMPAEPPRRAPEALPPLEPGALQIPVELPPAQTAAGSPSQESQNPGDRSLSAPVLPASPTPPVSAELPAPGTAAAPSSGQSGLINVPSVRSVPAPSSPQAPTAAAARLPVAASGGQSAAGSPSSVVEFGQPLPLQSSLAPATVLIPAGTTLNLRYVGTEPLTLTAEQPQQEVLLLTQAVRDRAGNTVIPANSEVLGRFEIGSQGGQFVVQAISWPGKNLTPTAAAIAYLNAQQPAVIQPNQLLEVRIEKDMAL